MGKWPVVIVDYDPIWVRHFTEISTELTESLRAVGGLIAIEHIGSTAVRGLAAKNIIDILMAAESLAIVNVKWVSALADLGYRYVPKHETALPMRRFFARYVEEAPNGPAITVHLHVVEPGSKFWREHILFRDVLREDTIIRDEYAVLKRELAAVHADDREGYTDAKGNFILRVIKRA